MAKKKSTKRTNREPKANPKARHGKSKRNYGDCEDCRKHIDVVVDAYQVVGMDELVCIGCRADRIIRAASVKVDKLMTNAEIARDNMKQLTLTL